MQVDAARELKLLPNLICTILAFFERKILSSSDYISTISFGMKRKISTKNISKDILLLPNWSDLQSIRPQHSTKWLHNYLGVPNDKLLIVYAGNIGEKQGLEIILDCAKDLINDKRIHFAILGEGLYKEKLKRLIHGNGLENLTISNLVPRARLNDMLNDSFIQLVIQKGNISDTLLPSKLSNIMAAGCAAIVTAKKGTSLYNILESSKGALIIRPEDPNALSEGIKYLLSNSHRYKKYKVASREWAELHLSIDNSLSPLLSIIDRIS